MAFSVLLPVATVCEGLSCTNIEILVMSDIDIDIVNEDEDE